MNVQRRNDEAIYCLSSGSNLPEWLGNQAKRSLSKRDDSIRRRIELLQDFQMPASSSKLIQSPDCRYVTVAGSYPPRIRCFDVHELSMKFERYLNAECIDMVMLSEDYGKMALLLEDRSISIHAPYGNHEIVRIPTFGRALAYEPTTCELLIAAKGNSLYRLNLEEGRFSDPWILEKEGKIEASHVSATSIAVNSLYPLTTVGCNDGLVRFWDSRSSDRMLLPFLKLDVGRATAGYGFSDPYNSIYNTQQPSGVTSIAHDPTGMYMAFGTASGVVALYDVRSSRPLHFQEHKQGLPIHTVKFHSGSGLVLSSDEQVIKAWHYKASSVSSVLPHQDSNSHSGIGTVKVNIEGNGRITHFVVAGDERDKFGNNNGLILCSTDQPKMDSFFVPSIGPAPKWCGFLETITEELEERDLHRDGTVNNVTGFDAPVQETVFENYKFVSRDDLEKLGVSSLIGTPLLRGYMHGFFMDLNLYNRVKAVANPFEYEEYQKKKLKERLDAKYASRINPRTTDTKLKPKKTSVNPALAERLENKAKASKKSSKTADNLLNDDRFGTLFTNPDFEIDEHDENFKLRNPSGVAAAKLEKNNLDSDDEDENDNDDFESDTNQLVNDGSDTVCSTEGEEDRSKEDTVKGNSEINKRSTSLQPNVKTSKKAKRAPRILDDWDQLVCDQLDTPGAMTHMPLGERVEVVKQIAGQENLQIRIAPGGSKEATFIPSDGRKDDAFSGSTKEENRQRRGVEGLGMKRQKNRK